MTAAMTHHVHVRPFGPDSHEPGAAENWRWQARRLLAEQRDLLLTHPAAAYDGWLAARGDGMLRERDSLLTRLAAMGPRVLHDPAIEDVRVALWRLLVDVEHHLQRRRDLVWDEVELELGGSE